MVHVCRLSRNGNSLTVAIAPQLLEALGWHRGDTLLSGMEKDRLVIRRVQEAQLLAAPVPAAAGRPARRRRA